MPAAGHVVIDAACETNGSPICGSIRLDGRLLLSPSDGGQLGIRSKIEAELAAFDLDGDGSFSPEETTMAAELAIKHRSSDSGSMLLILLGIPMSGIWVGLNFGVFALARNLWRTFKGKTPSPKLQ
jgi:hypothetical protein